MAHLFGMPVHNHHSSFDGSGTWHDGYSDGYDDGYFDASTGQMPHHHHLPVDAECYGLGTRFDAIDVYQCGVMLAVALSLSGAIDLVRRGKARVTSERSIELVR